MGRHHKHGPNTVTMNDQGDVTNMRSTIDETALNRPYAPVPTPDQKEKK